MDKSSTVHVGLDIHKHSIGLAVADTGRKGGLRHVDTIRGDLDVPDKALRIRG